MLLKTIKFYYKNNKWPIKKVNKLNHKNYYKITENSTCLCDIYIKNIKIKQSSYQFNDLSIMFNEKLNSDLKEIEFIAEIIEFGKLDKMSGHLIIVFYFE